MRILLDSGNPSVPEYIDLLKNVLLNQNCSLSNIVVSHWHLDHIGGVPDILEKIPGCKVSKFPRSDGKQEPVLNIDYTYLNEGDIISTEGATLRVVSAPGHTDDHLVLYLEEENSLFSGDCILGEGTAVFEDLHDYMLTLKKIFEMRPARIYPGHGPVIENPKKKIEDYINHRMAREKQILDTLEEIRPNGLTAKELVARIYIDTPKHLHGAAEVNVTHHLEKLKKGNMIGEKIESTMDGETKRYSLL
nr:endoribonuclease LACTB2 isoform X2 [Parasteatoda tepidariorum]